MGDKLKIADRKKALRERAMSGKYNTMQLRQWYKDNYDIRATVFYKDLKEIASDYVKVRNEESAMTMKEKRAEIEAYILEMLEKCDEKGHYATALKAIGMLATQWGLDVGFGGNIEFGNIKLRIAGTEKKNDEE
jgi:hypothetical protein